LRLATGYRVAGADRQLLDKDGAVVATLRRDSRRASQALPGFPKPPSGAELQLPPRRPANTPPPVKAPRREELLGNWYPEAAPDGGASLTVNADGTWSASDGCNGKGGRWHLAGDGTLLSTGGASTLIGCQNDQSGFNFDRARWVGLDGTVLVLLDSDGVAVSRLVR
jgi:heat shock protein HslJ